MELVGGIGGSGGTDNIIVVMKSYTLLASSHVMSNAKTDGSVRPDPWLLQPYQKTRYHFVTLCKLIRSLWQLVTSINSPYHSIH